MKYIGIDGCKSGWFHVAISHDKWEIGILKTLDNINSVADENSIILIDIPIGLREHESNERLCDIEARKHLKTPRSSSVFPAPARPTLFASDYEEAKQINDFNTGRKLSKQSFCIMPKIKEIDHFMCSKNNYGINMREMHPEICFWSLNNCQPMIHGKKKEEGFKERIAVLNQHYKHTEAIIESALNKYLRKELARDDITDALVGAVTAQYSQKLATLPVVPETDPQGLPMEMVYAAI